MFFNSNKLPKVEIQKNTPKKKGFALFLDILMREGVTLVNVNFLFIIFSLPIFTIGASFGALNHVVSKIAKAVEKHAPNAWVINYTNPMTMCIKALYDTFPKIKAFGCCHEVFETQKVLAKAYMDYTGEKDIEREQVDVNVLGINHFTWFDKASCKGLDLFPIYKEFIKKHANGYNKPDKHWANSSFESANLVKFDLFNKYGYIAAAGDRHLAEFMPGDMYLKNPEQVTSYKFGLTTVDYRKKDLEKRLAKANRLLNGEEQMELTPSGEEGIKQIKALCGLLKFVTNVNLPNDNLQISNLPKYAIVETNAVFSKDSVQTVNSGALPESLYDLIIKNVENQQDILNAAKNCDFSLALKALKNDPIVSTRVSYEKLEEMLKRMIENTKAYLPKEWN